MEQPSDTRQLSVQAQALAPGLYVVATPIGNLRDVTLRALDILASADAVFAEDTRTTRVLLDAYGLKAALSPYHEHNAAAARPKILNLIADGAAVALVSDAGTPLISDPGYKLVRDVVAAGHAVIAAPGASAVLAGVVVSGLPTDRFVFCGFPPAKAGARQSGFAELADVRATLVFFEAGSRLADSLAAMSDSFGAREAVLARELTKRFEEVRRGALPDLAAAIAEEGAPKGELVVLVGPPAGAAQWSAEHVDAALVVELADHPVKAAANAVAAQSGWRKRDVYARALALRARREDG